MSKTPVTVLQELVMKSGHNPEFTFVGQTGPAHSPSFTYRCSALGHEATGHGDCKRSAKHDAAARVLALLAASLPVPGAYKRPRPPAAAPPLQAAALLRELCVDRRLPAPDCRLVADTGPAHCRRFEVVVSVGGHSRTAAANNKKEARRLASAELYAYLRDHLPRRTADFEEDDALARALLARLAKDRSSAPVGWRPALGLRVADYHTALLAAARVCPGGSEEEDPPAPPDPVAALAYAEAGDWQAALSALRLPHRWEKLPTVSAECQLLVVEHTSPALVFPGVGKCEEEGRGNAGMATTRYLRRMLVD